MKLSSARYRSEANANDAFVVAACKLALSRPRNDAVLMLAQGAGSKHAAMMRAEGNPIPRAPDLTRQLAHLSYVPAGVFDRFFADTHTSVHRRVWSIHSGYAADGDDARLRRGPPEP